MKKHRIIAVLLTLCMTLTVPPTAVATGLEGDWLVSKVRDYPGFADVEGSWCEAYVKVCYEAGLLNGKTGDRFDPSGTLTEAQRLVIGARLHALLHGKTVEPAAEGEAWWLPAARYYLAQDGDTETDPLAFASLANDNALRLSFALQMAWSTPAEKLPAMNDIPAIPDYDDTVMHSSGIEETPVLNLYRAGILNGVDKWGTFHPQGTLTRGQAAAMLARVIDPALRLEYELQQFDLCRDGFQLEPDTVLMTVHGESITADQFSGRLADICNKTWYDPNDFGDLAVWKAEQDIAIEILAEEYGVSLDMIINLEDFEVTPAPGESDPSTKWRHGHDSLLSLLSYHYGGTAFHPVLFAQLPETLQKDLETKTEGLTTITAPALENMDWTAAQQRLLASPYGYDS